jgi:hypothetical protein
MRELANLSLTVSASTNTCSVLKRSQHRQSSVGGDWARLVKRFKSSLYQRQSILLLAL